MKKRLVITGGGTGGHVFPALSIAEACRDLGFEVAYLGSNRGLEARLAPEKGVRFLTVESGAVKNQGLIKTLTSLFQVLKGFLWSLKFLNKEKPNLVLGVGGYVSVPVCLAAYVLRIPIYLQEQNVSVGIANRFLGKLCRKVFLGFPEAQKYFSKNRVEVTGNPIRKDFFSPSFPRYSPSAKTLLILGGSQGAKAINQAIVELLPRFPTDWKIIHQTGKSDQPLVEEAYKNTFKGNYQVSAFINDMVGAYAQASLVISRSGALTVSELIQVSRPCIFVPYPRRGQNDQTANAQLLMQLGAALVVEQGPEFTARLWTAFESALSTPKLEQMSLALQRLHRPDPAATIANLIVAKAL